MKQCEVIQCYHILENGEVELISNLRYDFIIKSNLLGFLQDKESLLDARAKYGEYFGFVSEYSQLIPSEDFGQIQCSERWHKY